MWRGRRGDGGYHRGQPPPTRSCLNLFSQAVFLCTVRICPIQSAKNIRWVRALCLTQSIKWSATKWYSSGRLRCVGAVRTCCVLTFLLGQCGQLHGRSFSRHTQRTLQPGRSNAGGRQATSCMLPLGKSYLEKRIQFVHVDDVARLMAYILRRTEPEAQRLTILNVAGRGESLTFRVVLRWQMQSC